MANKIIRYEVTESGCWECTSHKPGKIHRLIYMRELEIKELPSNIFVCHSCDNRKCINPDHMFLGSHKDNMQDMVNKGRHSKSGLSKADVELIRNLYNFGLKTAKELAVMFNVSYKIIHYILNNKRWNYE